MTIPDVSRLTLLLRDWKGDGSANSDALLSLVYADLHRIAERMFCGESDAHTLQPTGIVHDALVQLVDTDQPVAVAQPRGHDDYVYSVAFSPDGELLASGSGDGTVRLWDTRSHQERYDAQRAAGRSR